MHAALVKGFFAEEGLRVQGMVVDIRAAVEQGKPHFLWVKTDQGLTEADFGFMDIDQLHHMAAGKIDYYIVEGLNFGCMEIGVWRLWSHRTRPSSPRLISRARRSR